MTFQRPSTICMRIVYSLKTKKGAAFQAATSKKQAWLLGVVKRDLHLLGMSSIMPTQAKTQLWRNPHGAEGSIIVNIVWPAIARVGNPNNRVARTLAEVFNWTTADHLSKRSMTALVGYALMPEVKVLDETPLDYPPTRIIAVPKEASSVFLSLAPNFDDERGLMVGGEGDFDTPTFSLDYDV